LKYAKFLAIFYSPQSRRSSSSAVEFPSQTVGSSPQVVLSSPQVVLSSPTICHFFPLKKSFMQIDPI